MLEGALPLRLPPYLLHPLLSLSPQSTLKWEPFQLSNSLGILPVACLPLTPLELSLSGNRDDVDVLWINLKARINAAKRRVCPSSLSLFPSSLTLLMSTGCEDFGQLFCLLSLNIVSSLSVVSLLSFRIPPSLS
jgi:hypothetical protein